MLGQCLLLYHHYKSWPYGRLPIMETDNFPGIRAVGHSYTDKTPIPIAEQTSKSTGCGDVIVHEHSNPTAGQLWLCHQNRPQINTVLYVSLSRVAKEILVYSDIAIAPLPVLACAKDGIECHLALSAFFHLLSRSAVFIERVHTGRAH